MKAPSPLLLAVYRNSLRLYPPHLRLRYYDQLLQTARDAHADRHTLALFFWLHLFADLLISSAKENLLMIREQVLARPIFFHALTLGLLFTMLGGAASAVFQGMLRHGANQPQAQMAAFYASKIASGVNPDEAIPRNNVDIERSLEPFVIFYNDQGAPNTATGYLNQAIPTLPPGVFHYLRTHSTDTVTWQPQSNVRIAAVIHRITGPNPGFLLTGRSLRVVEEQEDLFWKMAFSGWFIVVLLLAAGAALLTHVQQQKPSLN
jgi:hypothetical protein